MESGPQYSDQNTEAVTRRRHGLVVGQAAGDLIGGPRTLASILLQSVERCCGFDRSDVLQCYLDWWKTDGFDTGPVAAAIFKMAAAGMDIERAAELVHIKEGSMTAGCAPVHRNVVLAASPSVADRELDRCVREETRLTHLSPIAVDTAVAASRLARGPVTRKDEIRGANLI